MGSGQGGASGHARGVLAPGPGILAARILEDKGALGEGQASPPTRDSSSATTQGWDSFFDTVLDEDLPRLDGWFQRTLVDAMLRCLLGHLTGPVNFGLVTHEMLGDLYERALVAERRVQAVIRSSSSRVSITHRCRSPGRSSTASRSNTSRLHGGRLRFRLRFRSFLLAATERLAKLFDPREPESPKDASICQERGDGQRQGPRGDPRRETVLLAGLLEQSGPEVSIPYPHFHEGGDALTLELTPTFGRRPGVSSATRRST